MMGVSGSGKTLIGELLAGELGCLFIDADDYHPQSNIQKMSQGIPLTDQDRQPWLESLNSIAQTHLSKGCVIACSALKQSYRNQLEIGLEGRCHWVHLQGTYKRIFKRMSDRKNHFMSASMLQSQFDVLEPPKDAIEISIDQKPERILQQIQKAL